MTHTDANADTSDTSDHYVVKRLPDDSSNVRVEEFGTIQWDGLDEPAVIVEKR